MDNSNLAKRMKKYEAVPKNVLIRRMPVIMRIDGRAFHTFTRGFVRPFDNLLNKTMQETMKYLCENIQGCVLGYTQSDEISLVLIDYQRLTSDAWFDNEVQKMCSVGASIATMAFNKFFCKNVKGFDLLLAHNDYGDDTEENRVLLNNYQRSIEKGAMFDCRVFNLPKEEVTNYIYWRQLDASRNSIQMVGQANFSHNELQNKSCNDIQDMIMTLKGINWNDLPTYQKRGSCCIKYVETVAKYSIDLDGAVVSVLHNKWTIDDNIPIFKGADRDYINRLVMTGE